MSEWVFTLKLAFRSLGRNRRRSAITLAALTLSVAFVLIAFGFMAGLEEQSANNLIRMDYGHLKIVPADFDPASPSFDTLMALTDFPDSLIEVAGVEARAPRLKFPALLSDGLDQYPCLGYGLEKSLDAQVFDLVDFALQGRFWHEGERGMVVGSKVAKTFRIAPDSIGGAELTVLGRSTLGAIGAFDLPVLGVITTGYPLIDNGGVLLPLSLVQELLNAPGQVSEITLRLDNPDRLGSVQRQLQTALAEAGLKAKVLSWRDLGQDFLALHRVKTTGMGIAMFFYVLIAIIGVANAILISAFQRTREVGMLRALGMSPREIMRQFLSEGGFLGLVGALIGGALGTAFNLYLQEHGLNLTALYGDIELGYPIKDYLYTHFSWDYLLVTIVGAVLLSALAAYFPARRTARLTPSEALRSM